jgi:hypothetical protein
MGTISGVRPEKSPKKLKGTFQSAFNLLVEVVNASPEHVGDVDVLSSRLELTEISTSGSTRSELDFVSFR